MGKKMNNLWTLKRKGVGNEILEKKEEEFEVNEIDLKFGRARKGMESLKGFGRNLGRLMNELW